MARENAKPPLEIIIEQPSDQRIQMTLRGDVDAHSVRRLDGAFNEVMGDGIVWLVVDLSEVGYVSSAGVMRVITAQDQARNVGGDLVLAGAQPQVLQVFEMLGLKGLLRFAPGVTEAWRSMAKAS